MEDPIQDIGSSSGTQTDGDFQTLDDRIDRLQDENSDVEYAEWNGLRTELNPEGLEKLYDFETGGHHPVHLDDLLGKDGRYRVLHKLGSGGSAVVWLARDLHAASHAYVAVKVLVADATTDDCAELRTVQFKKMGLEDEPGAKFICMPHEHFRIDGPNGTHICLVYPVLGPRCSRIVTSPQDAGATRRRIAWEFCQVVATLHKHGICHGDLTSSNLLLRTSGLDGFSEDQLLEILGQPRPNQVLTEAGETPTESWAPRYLVYPIDFDRPELTKFITSEACLIDFGESYDFANPPSELGIPPYYRSPEYLMDKTVGLSCDIWALGCTLFEIRTGRRLFDLFDDEPGDHLFYMVMLLGPLPEPWWSQWSSRKRSFEDEPESQGRAMLTRETAESVNTPQRRPSPRSLNERLTEDLLGVGPGPTWEAGLQLVAFHQHDQMEVPDPQVLQQEIELFADLLAKILQYLPEQRPSVADILAHDWFKLV